MKTISKWTTPLVLLSGAAFSQVPSGNDTSDARLNTGVGSKALGGPAASAAGFADTAIGAGALYSNTTGTDNTASGADALAGNTTGLLNTAMGSQALYLNTTGNYNTATGTYALYSNATGANNTATGSNALSNNTTGANNTAVGSQALFGADCPDLCSTGSNNTGIGMNALFSYTTGANNTAAGAYALNGNTTGTDNAAVGFHALYSNIYGYRNSAVGSFALAANFNGNLNNAVGYGALAFNTTGSNNNAQGYLALENNTTGNNNIAIGEYAGYYLTTGSYNIDICNSGVAGENGTIRIGNSSQQSRAFIAGIAGTQVTGSAVYVTSSGQLGVMASSERYKTDIAPMGANTEKLQRLRPVSFHLKTDPKGPVQYGLIAEEVAKVYPELVIRDDAGKIQGVRYEELAPMLLNEVQRQQRINTGQAAEIRALKEQVVELNNLKTEITAALQQLKSKDRLLAQR
jgi:hypothetical protein